MNDRHLYLHPLDGGGKVHADTRFSDGGFTMSWQRTTIAFTWDGREWTGVCDDRPVSVTCADD